MTEQGADEADAAGHQPTPVATILDSARYVAELHGSFRRPVVVITLIGAAAGLVEAAALIAFVRAALAITTDDVGDPSIAGVTITMSPGSLLAVSLALAATAALLHILLARASVRLAQRVDINTRARLIDGFLGAEWSYVARYRNGRLQEAMSSLTNSTTRATSHLAIGLSSIVIVLALGVAALLASPLVSTILIGVPIVLFVVAGPSLRRLRQRASRNVAGQIGLSTATAGTADLALEYRTTGTQSIHAERMKDLARGHADRVARARTSGFTLTFLFKDSALIALIGVVGVLYLFTDLRDASITAAVLVIIRMLGYLQQAFRLLQEGAEEFATIGALRDAIDELEMHQEPDGDVPIEHIDRIEFDGVRYTYATSGVALDDVALSIDANTTVGVVGPSGAGKSTFAELLLGLRRPDAGHVRINGIDVGDLRRRDWTRLTALVPQHQQLAPVSVRDNIAFLRPWIDDDAVVDAARRAHVDHEIRLLPGGYDHELGSRTQGLSGGQRQRVAIARALAGRPQLLVLDEPTSALDSANEELFRQTLEELRGLVTIVVIAHRPATLEACDTVLHLRDGRVERHEPGPARYRSGTG